MEVLKWFIKRLREYAYMSKTKIFICYELLIRKMLQKLLDFDAFMHVITTQVEWMTKESWRKNNKTATYKIKSRNLNVMMDWEMRYYGLDIEQVWWIEKNIWGKSTIEGLDGMQTTKGSL